ncbi:MAG: DUF3006 domain-containing protein [Firmicutes bacterium]|nr:DUF3006 domain-containing protein [Bacillota bacterium]
MCGTGMILVSYVIDRVEDGTVVIEILSDAREIEFVEIPRAALPKGVREGDVLHKDGDGYVIDRAMTKKRRDEVQARLKRLYDKWM